MDDRDRTQGARLDRRRPQGVEKTACHQRDRTDAGHAIGGEPIARPLGESGIFDDMVVNMIDVGEETGELDKMLIKIADTYDEAVEVKLQAMVSLLEPALIVFMGAAVGTIVFAIFLAMLKIVEQIG